MPKRVGVTYSNRKKLEPYLNALRIPNLEPVLITSGEQPPHSVDGLLLTGGTDIDPQRYHQLPHPSADAPDAGRDELELRMLESALERDLPVLAICRGLQLVNVADGGTLHQHVEGHRLPGVAEAHSIDVEPDSTLARLIGPGACMVNSRHHQVVDRVGGHLRISARSADGQVEALERPDSRFVIAVQWHPEDLVDSRAESRKLFLAFAEAL